VKKLNKSQKIQEERYQFPYHYIPTLVNNNFSQFRVYPHFVGYEYLSYLNFILKQIDLIEFNSLLDIGCGDGRFLHEINKKSSNKNLLGIDYSEKAIRLANAMNERIKFVCANILDDTPCTDEKFDVITLIETLEHIPLNVIKIFIKKVSFYLKNTGLLIITVPSKNIPLSPKHFQHFDLKSLKHTLDPYFNVIEHYYLNKISKFIERINKIFINKYFIINQMRLRNLFYRNYIKNYLNSDRNNAGRIYAICTKN